jgi:cell division protein FtsX
VKHPFNQLFAWLQISPRHFFLAIVLGMLGVVAAVALERAETNFLMLTAGLPIVQIHSAPNFGTFRVSAPKSLFAGGVAVVSALLAAMIGHCIKEVFSK